MKISDSVCLISWIRRLDGHPDGSSSSTMRTTRDLIGRAIALWTTYGYPSSKIPWLWTSKVVSRAHSTRWGNPRSSKRSHRLSKFVSRAVETIQVKVSRKLCPRAIISLWSATILAQIHHSRTRRSSLWPPASKALQTRLTLAAMKMPRLMP